MFMKKGIMLLSLVFVMSVCTSSIFASEITDDYFDIAESYFKSNNYAKSLEYLDLILKIEPENKSAKLLRDKISPPRIEIKEEINKTSEILLKADEPKNFVILNVPQADIEKMDYDTNYYNRKGQEFYQKKEYNQAVEYFYKSVKLNKRNAQAYNNLAMAYWAKNNPSLAVKYFKKAHRINRRYTQPLVNLANMYKQTGDSKKQIYYLKKAVKINPNDYLAYYWLGDYYRSSGDYTSAISSFKEVVKINPKFSQAYLSLAMCFFEKEEFNYALIVLSQYCELVPDSDFAYFLMARVNLALCHYEEAKLWMEKAIAICDNGEYQFELAKINYYLGFYNDSIKALESLLRTGAATAEIFNYMGLSNYKLKNSDAAVANFERAISIDPLRPIYYYNLAQCYKSIGDKKNYVKNVNTATKINPVNFQDFIDLSYIYFDNGNPSYAINSLNSAIAKYPTVKSLYLSKLKIYEALGDNLHYNEVKNTIETRFNK